MRGAAPEGYCQKIFRRDFNEREPVVLSVENIPKAI
jgi:hypothetical protein